MEVPSAPNPNPLEANSYRIQKILDIQNCFEINKEERRKILKKYTKALSATNTTDTILTTASIGLEVTGVGLLTTIVLGMEIAALGMGAGSITLQYINKKLQHKADKHRQILILSKSKLNTIHNPISKVHEDGQISDEEFKLILEEETKFRDMKEEIRHKSVKALKNESFDTLLSMEKQEVIQKTTAFLEELKKIDFSIALA